MTTIADMPEMRPSARERAERFVRDPYRDSMSLDEAAEFGGECYENGYQAALSTLPPLIEAARADAYEQAAQLVEQVAADDDDSELGERAADAFNGGHHKRSMSDRLRDWNAVIASGIRALSPLPAPTGQWRPIETAPKEPSDVSGRGPKVLLWWPHWRNEYPIIGCWAPWGWAADEALSDDGVPPLAWCPLPAPPSTSAGQWRPKYRHKKRGTVYTMIGLASMQAKEPVGEGEPVVVYEGEDGRLWVRHKDEFNFERVAPPSATDRGE